MKKKHDSEKIEKKEYTIRDVALLAGVSPATVGRVIGGYGSASKKATQAVLEATEKLNYFPNAIAQSMKKKNTYTIGLIIANICNPYFSSIARAMEESLVKHGYHVIICNTDEDLEREISYMKTLYEKRIDGIMIASALKDSEKSKAEIDRIYKGPIPTIIIDREIPGLDLPTVTSDNFGGAYEATSHFIRLGHQRIGVIGTTISTLSHRVEGYKKALQDNHIPFDEFLIANKGVENIKAGDVREGYDTTKKMLEDPQLRPTAILTLNSLLTNGALLAIDELGLKIPDDIAVIGWDDFDLAPVLKPPLTVVKQSTYNIASIATNRLLSLINGLENGSSEEKKVVLATQLVIRESCGIKKV
ncbi:LacI family DNA-binding transcriptional regulator [Ammoniphilus sp. YIM 78166]|uniref:LacI family DNA-binding transcriptional regulator n=1 Tax=Ammoniphilus sp. YIM 78166 TaxID=1644106 RepID=UPI00106FA1E9|nr:LacI family DNA-binding transcriptional regulator [Ammoniphilus sp. YIM 78166]